MATIDVLWAKTGAADSQSWHPLLAHLLDSVHTAEALWDSWLAPQVRQLGRVSYWAAESKDDAA